MSSDSDSDQPESDDNRHLLQPRSPPPNGRMKQKTKAKIPKNKPEQQPTPDTGLVKKSGVKEMVVSALRDLHSRKGVSLYAIKKYIEKKYEVRAEKINYYIKKQIKQGLEDETIIQVTGVGASGSFKLNPLAKEKKKKIAKKKEKPIEKKKEAKQTKAEKTEPKSVKTKKKNANKAAKEAEVLNATPTKKKKTKSAKKTPIEKKSMIRRKSIGSIIKKPKMKPKSVAAV